MNRTIPWIIVAAVVVVVLAVLFMLPARRAGSPEATGTLKLSPLASPAIAPPVVATPSPSPTPTPEVLTPEKQQLTDLQGETDALTSDSGFDQDLQAIDAELQGI